MTVSHLDVSYVRKERYSRSNGRLFLTSITQFNFVVRLTMMKTVLENSSKKNLFDVMTDFKSGSWLWCRINCRPNAKRIFYPIYGFSTRKVGFCQIHHMKS